jgi:hypothetical protein
MERKNYNSRRPRKRASSTARKKQARSPQIRGPADQLPNSTADLVECRQPQQENCNGPIEDVQPGYQTTLIPGLVPHDEDEWLDVRADVISGLIRNGHDARVLFHVVQGIVAGGVPTVDNDELVEAIHRFGSLLSLWDLDGRVELLRDPIDDSGWHWLDILTNADEKDFGFACPVVIAIMRAAHRLK